MIGGAATGAFFVGNSLKGIKATFRSIPMLFKGSRYSKQLYMELMGLLYELLAKVRKEGLMSVESDVENPHESPIFSKYPKILADHHAVEFLTDYLRLMVSGNLNAFEIENLMDQGEQRSPEQDAALELMVRLVQYYEEKHHPLPDASPSEVLTYLMEQRGLKQADLVPIFKSRGYVSDVIHGKRAISKAAARQLAAFFNVSAELFI